MAEHGIVVVGAGMGGLAAALSLAARGHRVTLLEAGDRPGGKARQVDAGGRAVDAGPTVFTMRWVLDALFAEAGERVDDHLSMTQAERIARHAWADGARLDLFADPERSVEAVAAFAGPREADGFRAFSERARRVYERLAPAFIEAQKPGPLTVATAIGPSLGALADMAPGRSLWSVLGSHFRDPRLRQLFGRYATYVGGSPFLSPGLLMLIWHVEAAGVWRIRGGIHRLARVLAGLCAARGVRVRTGARVAEVTVAGGRATGVRLADGETLEARTVIFAGDAAALGAGLLGEAARAAVAPVAPGDRALSALTATCLARPSGMALCHHTVLFSEDYRAEFDQILARRRLPRHPTVYLCAQDRAETATREDGPERVLAIINAPADGDRRPFPKEETEQCLESAWRLAERCGVTLNPEPGTLTATTPADFERMFPGSGGALYGRAPHGTMASFRRPGARSRIGGLYLAGGTVHPGAGVPMAILSGRRAAEAAMADLGSTSPSRRGAMPGGISTASPTTDATRSPSSSSPAASSPPTTPGAAAAGRRTTAR